MENGGWGDWGLGIGQPPSHLSLISISLMFATDTRSPYALLTSFVTILKALFHKAFNKDNSHQS